MINATDDLDKQSSFKTKALFATGQIGWCLAMFGFSELIYMFYLPPDNGIPLFKSFVYQGPIFQDFYYNRLAYSSRLYNFCIYGTYSCCFE
jgi:hypothetical protein